MSTMVSNLELIRRVPLFAMLTASQAESVSQAVVKSGFKRGEAIVEQGKKIQLVGHHADRQGARDHHQTARAGGKSFWQPCSRATISVR